MTSNAKDNAMTKILTWRELLAFAQSLPAEALDKPVYCLGDEENYGPVYVAERADEEWVDDEFGEGPTRRSEVDFDGMDEEGALTTVLAVGDPLLWVSAP